MAQLVTRMEQKESPQQGIGRHFGSAHQISSAIRFGFGEAEQLARSPRRVEPHPPMDWPQQYPHHFGRAPTCPRSDCEYLETRKSFMIIGTSASVELFPPSDSDVHSVLRPAL